MLLREIFLPKLISDGEPPKKWWQKAATKLDRPVQEVAVEVEAKAISDVKVEINFKLQIILSSYEGIENLKKASDPFKVIKKGATEEDGWIKRLLDDEVLRAAFQDEFEKDALHGIAAIVDHESQHKTQVLAAKDISRIKLNFQIDLTVNSSSQITQEEAYYLVKPKIREELIRTLLLNLQKISQKKTVYKNGSLKSKAVSKSEDTSVISLHEKARELPSLDRFKLPEGVKVPEKK